MVCMPCDAVSLSQVELALGFSGHVTERSANRAPNLRQPIAHQPGVSRAVRSTLRLIFPENAADRIACASDTDEPVAEVRGVNVHAKQVIDGRDRARLERLCK
jgi:hypothetical protein